MQWKWRTASHRKMASQELTNHNSDGTRRFKWPVNRLFVQQLVGVHIKGDTKAPHNWTFVGINHRWPVDSPHSGPVTRKVFPYRDVMQALRHVDDTKWKHFPRYRPFERGIHRSPVNSPHKGQWCGALLFSLICTWRNDWVNNTEAGELRRHRVHYDTTVMIYLPVVNISVKITPRTHVIPNMA